MAPQKPSGPRSYILNVQSLIWEVFDGCSFSFLDHLRKDIQNIQKSWVHG